MKKFSFFVFLLSCTVNGFSQTTYTGIFRSPSDNQTYHHLIRDNAAGAALYVNQVNADPSSRILQLSSGTSAPAQGIKFTVLSNGKVGILTAKPDSELTVKGNIHAQEVKVDLNGAIVPDYVFKSDYDLPSLELIKKYIDSQGHLPGIPSASAFENNGVNLKDMNFLLLKKIEELTLYTINQQQILNELMKTIEVQNEEIKKLKSKKINEN